MSDEKQPGSATPPEGGGAGSPENLIQGAVDPNKIDGGFDPNATKDEGESGQPDDKGQKKDEGKPSEEMVPKSQLKEAQKIAGDNSDELGGYRDFMKTISPLLNKLESNPELLNAIMEDKFTPELAKAVADGKVSITDAKAVTEAHDKVKKDLGTDYNKTSPEDINKLVTEQVTKVVGEAVSKVKSEFDSRLSSSEKQKEYMDDISEFIKNTPDFAEHAPEVEKYMKEHPGIFDIQLIFDAVAGKAAMKKLAGNKDENEIEEKKKLAAAAAAGGAPNTAAINGDDNFDTYIKGHGNPNIF